MKKELVTKNSEIIIDSTSGEVLSSSKTTSIAVGNEPQYFKIYTDAITDVANICNLNDTEKNVFLSLARNMSFNNKVVLLKPTKELLMADAQINSLNTLNKAIDNLYKKGFLLRDARSLYTVNPEIAGKGKWENIKALRLTIDYTKEGRIFEIKKITPNNIEIEEIYHQVTLEECIERAGKENEIKYGTL